LNTYSVFLRLFYEEAALILWKFHSKTNLSIHFCSKAAESSHLNYVSLKSFISIDFFILALLYDFYYKQLEFEAILMCYMISMVKNDQNTEKNSLHANIII
jgi:hypothetical protein